MKAAAVVVPAMVEDADKDKKKKSRRSGRRSKQTSSTSSACSSVTEVCIDVPEHIGNVITSNHAATSLLNQNQFDVPPFDLAMIGAYNFPFSSFPPMHVNGIFNPVNGQSSGNQYSLPCEPVMLVNSCPETVVGGGSPGMLTMKDFPPQQIESYAAARRKCFVPHWSVEAVKDALEKGGIFKALFRINAHNRVEAYCKIDGVPTDILISGLAEQNRAVEGDIVAIKVDPLPAWTRMKGSAGTGTNSTLVEDFNLPHEDNEIAGHNCKGKAKLDEVNMYANGKRNLLSERGSCPEESTSLGESIHSQPSAQSSYDYICGRYPAASDSIQAGSCSEQNEVRAAVERMCAMISSFPSKRPTGRVVAIIERSRSRDAVVGFLNVKQLICYKQSSRKETKNNKSLSFANHEYIHMTPTDPRFPKMLVLVRNLPDSIKKRLEKGDETIELELFSAQIDEWDENSSAPQAVILNTFGRAGEVQTQIEAILFQNSINSPEFSPESLSCLPHLPWEVPQEELISRKDLRNLCIFTIDPSTVTDLDDALSVEKLSNGISRVGIHIADASYFVLPGTPLDEEAQSRSTSVYMTQRKLPMLPPLLSENIGSLNPGVERLAFSVFLDLNEAGDVVDRWIGRTVIRSCCKLSYEHAQEIIDGNSETSKILGKGQPQLHGHFEWFDVIRSVKDLHEISLVLKKRRFNGGALQLESSKVVIVFDEDGVPYDSMHYESKESNFLVEELMLLANRTVAEVISRAFPDNALLRRHPEPNMRKLREFEAFCSKHGLELDTSSSGQFQQSLKKIKEKLKDDSVLFSILMNYATRPMQLAAYFCSGELKVREDDWGHYGLAVPLYTHFTSPLRRYPDIVVHRTLAAAIEAEELLLKRRRMLNSFKKGDEVKMRCFTGIYFDKDAAESIESREALSAAAIKHRVPCSETLADVAAYCNDRELASRHVKDACDKLYMWAMLKEKKVLFSEARVLGLGPRFMSLYIQKLAVERRIYYDDVEGLMVEWLDATSTLVLTLCSNKRVLRRGSPGKWKALEDAAIVVRPYDLKVQQSAGDNSNEGAADQDVGGAAYSSELTPNYSEISPMVFPLTVRVLSTIPVALHAIGGDDGPVDIEAKLYMSSYLF